MLQSNDTEKPYLLHHLIIHGVLAVAFLAMGWLFPAQYRTLHTDALAQASVEEGQTLEEFRDSLGETNQFGAGQLLDLAAQQLEPSTNALKTLPTDPALDPFFSPSHRRTVKARLGSETKRVNQLLALESQAADYAAAIILAAQLEANGQFHQDLNQQLHSLGLDANTDELRKAMRDFSLLASRLTEPQLGLLMRHTESTLTLMRLAKIAKLQTLVSPFDTFNEVDENGKSDDVITADELIGTPFHKLFGHVVVPHAKGQPVKWDADGNGKLTREEWTALSFIPLKLTEFPAVYAASVWSEQPEKVTRYLMSHGRPGTRWLQNAMRQGRGSMKMVLDRQLPVSDRAGLGHWLPSAAAFSLRHPGWALFVKFLLLGLGCIILMRAWNSFFTVSATGANAVRDFILRRRAMACALFLTLVALGEPIFLQPAQSSEYTVSINLPVLSEDENQTSTPKNNIAMLANSNIVLNVILFLAFAAIQLFVYLTCKSKVDEIRQGEGDPLLKLRLLENEDNLFDMGLYIGIAGTALTLAIKMLAPQFGISLSVAYASNIFGILCVALVKIHHVRGARQQLIMDAEATPGVQTH